MSYSVNTKCNNCAKQPTCSDGNVITGAVQGIIHSLNQQKGHQGWGTVILDCQGFKEKEAVAS